MMYLRRGIQAISKWCLIEDILIWGSRTLYVPCKSLSFRPTELTPLTIAVSLAGTSGDALGQNFCGMMRRLGNLCERERERVPNAAPSCPAVAGVC